MAFSFSKIGCGDKFRAFCLPHSSVLVILEKQTQTLTCTVFFLNNFEKSVILLIVIDGILGTYWFLDF